MSAPSSRPVKSLNPPNNHTEPAKTTRNRTRHRNRNRRPVQRQATDPLSHDSNASCQVPNTSLSSSNDHLQNGESSNPPDTGSEVPSSPQQTDPSPNDLPSGHAQGFSQNTGTASYYPHPQNGAAGAFPPGFFTSYNPYAGQPATNTAPYNPWAAYGHANIVSGHPDAHSLAAIQASYYQAANHQAQRAGYYPQLHPQIADPSSSAHHAYLQSHPYYSQASSFSYVHSRPSLLAQGSFFFDSYGHSVIPEQQADTLKQAISIAHRLVFSRSSLQILSRVLLGRSRYRYNGNAHIAAILDALVRNDGMSVIVDRETRRSGLVLSEEPEVLRVNATVSHIMGLRM